MRPPRSHIFIRPLNPQSETDIRETERAMEDSGNRFPTGAFKLPSTQIYLATRDGEILLAQPFYLSMVAGSLAWSGKVSDMEKAECQKGMIQMAFTHCHRMGLLDVITFSNTPETRHFALRHGFEIEDHAALRMKVREG